MPIKLLSPTTINRIAAGEVIERPASVVKELVENAIDAGATQIDVVINNGGRNLVSVADNGSGMTHDELQLCIQRHATSKLTDDDLFDIKNLGFRGEAIPSIGSVSRMTITSRKKGADEAWSLHIEGGDEQAPCPAQLARGTKIDVRDLFYATPARLKFLKTERTEKLYIQEVINKLSMAYPQVSFSLKDEKRSLIDTKAAQGELLELLKSRLGDILGKDFEQNSVHVDTRREDIALKGYIALPTFNKGNSNSQYLFVNGRPVKDKLLLGAVRAAYQDFIARDRYPVVALFLELGGQEVDVNVHPTKAEVRFRDTGLVRGLIVGALKNALSEVGHRASTTVSDQALSSFNKPSGNIAAFPRPSFDAVKQTFPDYLPEGSEENNSSMQEKKIADFQSPSFASRRPSMPTVSNDVLFSSESALFSAKSEEPEYEQTQQENNPLGAARCQLHKNYIIAQTENGIVIVDQHAAHERLVYEEMKKAMATSGVRTQRLLIPEVVALDAVQIDNLTAKQDELAQLGLLFDKFGEKEIVVNATPALLGQMDVKGLMISLAHDIAEYDNILSINEALEIVCSNMACHGAVRSGRVLNNNEMNAILRDMEATPYSGQCNHGRPTYVELKLHDIEKLFGRK